MSCIDVLVVGSLGSIGSLYMHAIPACGVRAAACGWDVADHRVTGRPPYDRYGHVLIATPTQTHHDVAMDAIRSMASGSRILIEKPMSLDVHEIDDMARAAEERGIDLRCVCNWAYPWDDEPLKPHRYPIRYSSRSLGRETLAANICQLLYYSSDLKYEESDIWRLTINNRWVDFEEWQHCYRRMLYHWLTGDVPLMDAAEARKMTEEALKWAN